MQSLFPVLMKNWRIIKCTQKLWCKIYTYLKYKEVKTCTANNHVYSCWTMLTPSDDYISIKLSELIILPLEGNSKVIKCYSQYICTHIYVHMLYSLILTSSEWRNNMECCFNIILSMECHEWICNECSKYSYGV